MQNTNDNDFFRACKIENAVVLANKVAVLRVNENQSIQACQAAGRSDIIIVGFDADADAITAIQEGKMAATIAQMADMMGYRGIELAHMYLNGEEVPKKEAVEVALITKDSQQ